MSRQEALEELAASVQVDTAAGVDPEAQSIPVYGNVQVAALKALGFYIPEAEAKPKGEPEVFACQNCDWEGPESALGEIQHFFERVAPGEVMPYGECPECGAVCHATSKKLCPGCGENPADEDRLDRHCAECVTADAEEVEG